MHSLKLNKPETNKLIERTFDAFAWRKPPDEVWDHDHSEANQFPGEFLPMTPTEFSFDVFESEPWNGQGEAIRGLSVEGFLYYLPSFLSLLLQDRKRFWGLEAEVLCKLRSRAVYSGPFTMWILHVRYQTSFSGSFVECNDPDVRRSIDNLLDWYVLKAESNQCDVIARMTQQEREVVAQCLDCFERTLKDEWLHGWRWTVNWIEAVRGVLLDAPLSRRLGARNDCDMADLIDLLEMAERCYPRIFSETLTEPTKRELRKELAALPPPASRKFVAGNAETREIIEQAFEAFSWRSQPKAMWRKDSWEAMEYSEEFQPVAPAEFDFDVFESPPWHSQSDRLYFLTVDGFLYYLPSFLSLILEDWDRSNELEVAILSSLRGWDLNRRPFVGWIPHINEPHPYDPSWVVSKDIDPSVDGKRSLQKLSEWFVLKADSSESVQISNMTQQERKVVARCLDRFEQTIRVENLGYWRYYPNWIEAVRGVLQDGPLSCRLGARNDEDVADLIDLLEMAERLYPGVFQTRLTEPIKTQLYQELGSWDAKPQIDRS